MMIITTDLRGIPAIILPFLPALINSERVLEQSCQSFTKPAGDCRAAIQSYFYDPTDDTCKSFVYSGCDDNNDNNYEDPFECMNRCGLSTTGVNFDELGYAYGGHNWKDDEAVVNMMNMMEEMTLEHRDKLVAESEKNNAANSQIIFQYPIDEVVCSMEPSVQGDCRAQHGRWSFNQETNKCEYFNYGGCDGNANNFGEIEECLQVCGQEDTGIDVELYLYSLFGYGYKDSADAESYREKFNNFFEVVKEETLEAKKVTVIDNEKTSIPGRYTDQSTCMKKVLESKADCDKRVLSYYYDMTSNSCTAYIDKSCEKQGETTFTDNIFSNVMDCVDRCAPDNSVDLNLDNIKKMSQGRKNAIKKVFEKQVEFVMKSWTDTLKQDKDGKYIMPMGMGGNGGPPPPMGGPPMGGPPPPVPMADDPPAPALDQECGTDEKAKKCEENGTIALFLKSISDSNNEISDPVSEPTNKEQVDQEASSNIYVIGAVVVLAVVGIVLFMMKKKKNVPETEEDAEQGVKLQG